jgi:hypothetical protein
MTGGVDGARLNSLAAPADALDGGVPELNSGIGLSTDYLNHFTEAVMALELLAAMPDGLSDLRAWRPKTYSEHFATSRFTARDAMIGAYRSADTRLRQDIDRLADELNTRIETARNVAIATPDEATTSLFIEQAMREIKPLIVRLAALINGQASNPAAMSQHTQAAIDDLFSR